MSNHAPVDVSPFLRIRVVGRFGAFLARHATPLPRVGGLSEQAEGSPWIAFALIAASKADQ
jgi:hypothetical protein